MKLPIDTTNMRFIAGGEPTVVVRNRQTGETATDKDTGLPIYRLDVMALQANDNRPEIWSVKLVGAPERIVTGTALRLDGLVANYYEFTDPNQGSRHGISFSATAAAAVAPAKSAATT
ncbi:MAG: hypothetical protein ACK5OX_06980 [Desertimonas sp.]